jgi:ABC-type antimicrobial peptide transport system permease subunit
LLLESLREAGGISVMSCALGLPLAWVVKEALRRSIVLPTDFGISIGARIDSRVGMLTAAVALAAAIVCGVAPACISTNVWATLKAQDRGTGGRRRNILAILEIALASALVATGGSLWMGLNAAQNVDLGYRAGHVAAMTFDPGQFGYSETRTRTFYRELMERVQALPGVRGVALAQSVPLGMTGAQKQIRIGQQEEMTVWMNIVTPEYFARMHIGFIGGRTFDDEGGGVIINEELAKRVGLGEKMKIGGKTVEVIGVVKTAKYMRWDEAPRPFFYLPYAQNYASRMTLHVESSQDIFAAVRSLAREIPGSDARMLRDYFDQGAMFGVRAALRIAGIAGGAGLLLALAGLYGMVASSVARRRREIGIRVALGARHATIFRMIAGQGMTIAPIGIGLGLAAAHYGSQWLPAPATSSGWASAGAAGLILAASFVACAAPAIRALRLDPAVVLRED